MHHARCVVPAIAASLVAAALPYAAAAAQESSASITVNATIVRSITGGAAALAPPTAETMGADAGYELAIRVVVVEGTVARGGSGTVVILGDGPARPLVLRVGERAVVARRVSMAAARAELRRLRLTVPGASGSVQVVCELTSLGASAQ